MIRCSRGLLRRPAKITQETIEATEVLGSRAGFRAKLSFSARPVKSQAVIPPIPGIHSIRAFQVQTMHDLMSYQDESSGGKTRNKHKTKPKSSRRNSSAKRFATARRAKKTKGGVKKKASPARRLHLRRAHPARSTKRALKAKVAQRSKTIRNRGRASTSSRRPKVRQTKTRLEAASKANRHARRKHTTSGRSRRPSPHLRQAKPDSSPSPTTSRGSGKVKRRKHVVGGFRGKKLRSPLVRKATRTKRALRRSEGSPTSPPKSSASPHHRVEYTGTKPQLSLMMRRLKALRAIARRNEAKRRRQ